MTSLEEWIDMNRQKFITIHNITTLEPGQTIKLLCIDRNFYDCLPVNVYSPDSAMDPESFFQNNYIAEYRHGSDLHVDLMMNCDNEWSPFNFHLNYRDHSWYPLNNDGILPYEDPQGFADFSGVQLDYRDYPAGTLVGWRGPMIEWKHVENSDNIYWDEPYIMNS